MEEDDDDDKAVFTDVFSLFPDPNFTILIVPAQAAWSF
jgi:hypothetical protein